MPTDDELKELRNSPAYMIASTDEEGCTLYQGDRLREERQRLNLKEGSVARLIGVDKIMYLEHEGQRGVHKQLTQLKIVRLAQAGFDVQYVLIGKRSGEKLNDEERALIESYRLATDEGRAAVRQVGNAVEKIPVRRARR